MSVPNSSRIAPWRQTYWDWRAAGNFIFGGTGSGALVYAAVIPGAAPILGPLGAAFVVCGLLCVWFEIGRPWRALNVFSRPRSSWMSREALIAPWLIATGSLAVVPQLAELRVVAGAFALAYVYCQARMLNAARGIPAWRHPRAVPLLVVTGLAEGAGVGVLAGSLSAPAIATASWIAWPLAGLIALRIAAVIAYRHGLDRDGAPQNLLRDLARGAPKRLAVEVGAIVAALAQLAWPRGGNLPIDAAALLAVAAGWSWKYAIVVRWSYNQGFALPLTPVRGVGVSGPGTRPGW